MFVLVLKEPGNYTKKMIQEVTEFDAKWAKSSTGLVAKSNVC